MITAVLTIDDISSDNTISIVDYLNKKGIQAIMFAVGKYVEENPDPAIYAIQRGMIVGNHSFSHPAFSELSYEEGVREIERCEEQLDILYRKAGVERKYRPFRFPYGYKGSNNKDRLQEYLRNHEFTKVSDKRITYPWWKESGLDKDIDTLWTFDFAEYNIRPESEFTLDDVWKKVYDKSPESGGVLLEDGSNHILLLHAHDETEELVPEYYKLFVEKLIDEGVTFVKPEFM